ncbi:MAG: acetylxylan esterase [Bryobacterales bacterium]|nr:acetylxylan esterase [Bryobacterales bacterium]
MRRPILVSIALTGIQLVAAPQTPAEQPGDNQTAAARPANPAYAASEEDRQRLMDLLGIKTLRLGPTSRNEVQPGRSGLVNYDESKANPYPNLPDPLVLKNGKKVTSAKMWWNRRRLEIVEDFDREIYGRMPKVTPKVKWEVVSTGRGKNGGIDIITKQLAGHVDNSAFPSITVDIQLTLNTPADAKVPVPVVMQFGGGFGGARGAARPPQVPAWQSQVLAKGWGYAILNPASIQADNGAGLVQGIIGLVNKGQPRKVDDWGSLRAWGWGASRAIDYFETDPSVDANHIAIEGHSRYGKAALVAMAYEPRMWTAYVSSSGEGGAKLHRRNWGEQVENVAAPNEYHWMAGNFLKYSSHLNAGDLPVDSHELVALCAPRPVFLSAGSLEAGDGWVDAKGTFMAGAGAGPVYKLLGKKDMGTNEFPTIEKGLMDGDVSFRQHAGGHTDGPNWPAFLAFAERYSKVPAPARK